MHRCFLLGMYLTDAMSHKNRATVPQYNSGAFWAIVVLFVAVERSLLT